MTRAIHRSACLLAALSLAACTTLQDSRDTPGAAAPADAAGPDVSTPANEAAAKARLAKIEPNAAAKIDAATRAQQDHDPAGPHHELHLEDLFPEDPAFEDLLVRLRNGFALPPVERNEVERQAQWFVNNPAYLERVFDRARPWLPFLADEIEARGLPTELAFIPVIESAFDPFAYSHGRAAGLWQIIPGTGRRFGLRQSWWYDGRRDVVESTRAALDYLEYLHGLFDGDWLLAMAAYNCGEGTVGRAIRANAAAGQPTDFWHLRLPAETRGYVPRILGLTAVIADPDGHELVLPELPNQPMFTTVEVDSQIDLAIAAELAGIELAELQALNPGFNRWATDPEGPHRLALPIAVAEPFTAALADLPPGERVRWHRHAVRNGETLGAIARQYRTTIAVLQEVNGLSGTQIRAGSHLMVPTSSRSMSAYPLSADNRLAQTQARERSGRVRSEYTVRGGDSLWTIARRHGVGVRELAAWNGMAPGDTLSVGRRLVIWQSAAGTAGAPATSPASAPPTPGVVPTSAPQIRRVNYTVRRGDSLYRIASNFRVSVDDIKRWNNLDGSRFLQPGQRLILHVDVTAQSGG